MYISIQFIYYYRSVSQWTINMHTIQSALTNAMQCPICVLCNIYIGPICIISVFTHNQHITLMIEFNLYVTSNKVYHLLDLQYFGLAFENVVGKSDSDPKATSKQDLTVRSIQVQKCYW